MADHLAPLAGLRRAVAVRRRPARGAGDGRLHLGPVGGERINSRTGQLGQSFFQTILGIQLTLVLLAAPAATAGSICIDKARGTLAHVLVTDLTSSEVVLGKLAARLATVMALLACTLPLLALLTLLGGIDPVALTGAFLVTAGTAILACTLALSVWGRRAHEVLMVTYAIEAVWCLAAPTWALLDIFGSRGFSRMDGSWLYLFNPYWMAFAPSTYPGQVAIWEQAIYFAGTLLTSVTLAIVAIKRIRSVAAGQGPRAARKRPRLAWLPPDPAPVRWLRRLGPSLDGNPVLWREWHRKGASGWGRGIWRLYALAFGVAAVLPALQSNATRAEILGVAVSAVGVMIGLLLLSVSAATPLAEERQRGSLDVLLATPLPTRSIVLGKWWGTFRTVPRLAVLPASIAFSLGDADHRWPAILVAALMLAYGAAITSLGLAIATWVPRMGRAMTLTIMGYVAMTVGVPMIAATLAPAGPDQRWVLGLHHRQPALWRGNPRPSNDSAP